MVVVDFDPTSVARYTQHYNIVAVDVLRATSTMIVALANGTSSVIVCAEVEDALSFRKSPQCLLVGERKAVKIDGFDFTNSPYDLSQESLIGRDLVLTTTTGTKLITNSRQARHVLIGSTLNYLAVVNKMVTLGGDWAIIGAGSHGDFRDEDKVGCALIANCYLRASCCHTSKELRHFINQYTTSIGDIIQASVSSRKLKSLGRQCDIDFVIDHTGQYFVVPVLTKSMSDQIAICKNEGGKSA